LKLPSVVATNLSPGTQRVGCGRSVTDLVVLMAALWPAWIAGYRLRGVPLEQALGRLGQTSIPLSARRAAVEAIRCAATRASRYVGYVGGLDSCVTRSLVIATLLRGRGNITLAVGFLRTTNPGGEPEGHAWVCLDGVNVSDPDPGAVAERYVACRMLPYGVSG
jgi:hypothetical protein